MPPALNVTGRFHVQAEAVRDGKASQVLGQTVLLLLRQAQFNHTPDMGKVEQA